MTSTYQKPPPSLATTTTDAPAAIVESPPSDSSFSDAYEEQEEAVGGSKVESQDADVSDDYAMTFDSDGEDHTDSHDQSHPVVEQDTTNLSVAVPTTELPLSLPIDRNTLESPHVGKDAQPAHSIPSPIHSADLDATAAKKFDATHTTAQTSNAHINEDSANGGIDIQQLLDNITANAEMNAAANAPSRPSSSNTSHKPSIGSSSLPTHLSLPPRPQQHSTRPIYTIHDNTQLYHAAGTPGYAAPSNAYRPPGVTTSIVAAGAPGTSTDPRNGLPPPPSASFPSTKPVDPPMHKEPRRQNSQDSTRPFDSSEEVDEADKPWGPEVQKIYDEFLANERGYVTEGQWDRFPIGSRLFIGNLPSEKVTKRDIFHVFHKYGKLAQISIKQAYGFVQFHEAAACRNALDQEQGKEVRGRKMHLEISKAQKNTRNAQATNAPVRGSRSPDYGRGGMSGRGRNSYGQSGGRPSNIDHYDTRSGPQRGGPDYGRQQRPRDAYRPERSPSPRSYRGRDHLDRPRGRSRSPIRRNRNAGYRDRSPSPRMREANEDADLQIPRRDPHNVPDVQIILMAELDRGFVSWVEGELRTRGIKSEVMFLSPRLSLQTVIRRQIIEGVHAVSQLDMKSQNSSKIPLQVFDRQGGVDAVRFDEYQDLEPKIAAELVLRAKQTQRSPQNPAPYSQPQYAPPTQSYQQPPSVAPAISDLTKLVGQLDNATLQKLLGTLNTMPQQQTNHPAVAQNAAIDLGSLLSGFAQQQAPLQQQVYQQQPQQVGSPYNNYGGGNPAPQQSAQQVQNIMAQLAKFRQ